VSDDGEELTVREARDSLERARSQFRALGAPRWEARPDSALARLGGRTASPTELSETERRVADLVARGLMNKETAERLFLSIKTVESNLSRVSEARRQVAHRPRGSPPNVHVATPAGVISSRSNVGILSFPPS
jgi:DNA-binding CsgD family transcriptional regulator